MVLLGALVLTAAASVKTPPMNKDSPQGGLYKIANPPEGKSPFVDASLHAHRGEFIEVHSYNISNHYSEVFWTMQPPVALPADFVARFKGKVVALTGYEVDIVRVGADGSEVHVPLFDVYDHHHCAYVHGAASQLVDVGPAGSERTVDGHGSYGGRWEARPKPLTSAEKKKADPHSRIPTGAFLVDGNGGEFRMSLHGTAKGSAMLVQSPELFQVQPMLINTHNPNGKGPGNWELMPPGAYGAAASSFHRAPENSLYSPLLECPCTDRKPKVVTRHNTLEKGLCKARLPSAAECFKAAAALGLLPLAKNETQSEATAPEGCYVMSTKDGYEVFFNSAASAVTCGPSSTGPARPVRSTGAAQETASGVGVHLQLDQGAGTCSNASSDLSGTWTYDGSKYGPKHSSGAPYSVAFSAMAGKPGYYAVKPTDEAAEYNTMNAGVCATGCTAHFVGGKLTMTGGMTMGGAVKADWTTITWSNGAPWTRAARSCSGLATFTMTGPAATWFGVGFDSTHMDDKPYAIIVTGGTGAVSERRMANHAAGTLLAPSVTVISNTVLAGKRTVVISRPLIGATPQHLTIDAAASGVPFIAVSSPAPTACSHLLPLTCSHRLLP